MTSLNTKEQRQTPHHRRKDFVKVPMESLEVVLRELTILESSTSPGPIMMMDQLTMSTPTASTRIHKERSEPEVELQNDVKPVPSYNYPTPETPWLEYSGYCCEFCGHRAPHSLLKILHSRRHPPKFNNAKDRLRELYKNV
ncbi:hypothetical protein GE061_002564 [Apolygus lucorum]|uniref:Uncharacterized protein n=1 Tax=Apolygus lucorum TaxID=248454 RepID=A0A8S9X6U8_APOLU|nr:hypothetical protein GE061_002564 [Apolygus lucorum]